MNKKVALITGVTGQDGSYLAELLLAKGYEVHGIARRTSSLNRSRIDAISDRARRDNLHFELHYGDLGDSSSLNRIISQLAPDELYNLAAQSHVGISFMQPEYTTDIAATGTLRLLEAVRSAGLKTRFYQASTSELFGEVKEVPQSENTPFCPRSPYAVAKLYGFWIVKNYRESYGMHASNGILFNHESPRRAENFVTRKITLGIAAVKAGKQKTLRLGNLGAKRDWGFAGDYVEMMWRMLQEDKPDDYVAATGETHSVREFVEQAGRVAGYEICWKGSNVDEKGYDAATGQVIVEIDPRYYRPAEVELLVGDPSKARRRLGWQHQVSFEKLVKMMMIADLKQYGLA